MEQLPLGGTIRVFGEGLFCYDCGNFLGSGEPSREVWCCRKVRFLPRTVANGKGGGWHELIHCASLKEFQDGLGWKPTREEVERRFTEEG